MTGTARKAVSSHGPYATVSTVAAAAATAVCPDTFHPTVMIPPTASPARTVATMAIRSCGACMASNSPRPARFEAAATARGTNRCSRMLTCTSVHQRRQTPSTTTPSGKPPQITAVTRPQAIPSAVPVLCQPTTSSSTMKTLPGASTSVTSRATRDGLTRSPAGFFASHDRNPYHRPAVKRRERRRNAGGSHLCPRDEATFRSGSRSFQPNGRWFLIIAPRSNGTAVTPRAAISAS
jgi:hypothetical protein